MMHSLISNIKRVLPAVLVCGGLFASLFTFPATVSAGEELTGSIADSSVSANAESDSSVSAGAENDSSIPPADESSLSPGEETVHITREDMRPAGMLYISQSEALNWLHNAVGVSIDFDGAYGAQCVDLLKAYYDYLGVGAQHGNAQDYRSNFLPQGWQRIEGADSFRRAGSASRAPTLCRGTSSSMSAELTVMSPSTNLITRPTTRIGAFRTSST